MSKELSDLATFLGISVGSTIILSCGIAYVAEKTIELMGNYSHILSRNPLSFFYNTTKDKSDIEN